MKLVLTLGACTLLALTAACASEPHAYGDKAPAKSAAGSASAAKDAPSGADDMAKMMAMWEKAGALGPQHQAFAKSVGKWNLAVKSWMEPGSPPMESKSTATRELALDGRYMVEHTQGDMGPMGTFKGMGILGFNNLTQQYDHVWMDSMSTAMMVSHGTAAADGTVTMVGSYDDPMGGKTTARMVIHHVSADEERFEMWENRGQGDMQVMEIVYTRAKP